MFEANGTRIYQFKVIFSLLQSDKIRLVETQIPKMSNQIELTLIFCRLLIENYFNVFSCGYQIFSVFKNAIYSESGLLPNRYKYTRNRLIVDRI